ncbi:MAG: kelch repeat-containing protein [Spirochaetota bacterium]
MKSISRVSLVALCCATVFHCSGKSNMQVATPGNNDIKAPNEATSVQARVLADTGATLAIGNSLQLTVPAGALSQDTDITVEKKSVAPAQGIVVPVAKSIELGAHGTQFNKTVALNVCYDPQVLASQGLYEETLAVYYVDAQTGEYGSVGGSVNKTTHCVSANIEHFSTYLVAAQNLSVNLPVAEQLPQISVTYLPGTPIAGLPVKVRAAITDFKLTPVSNGTGVQVGFGQIATVRYCYYTAPATACSGGLQNLAPDYDDEANNFYSFVIPASQVTTQGFTVSYEVYNSLGFKRTRTVNYVPTRTATGIQFTSNAVVNLAAGFKRSYTVQGLSDTGTPQNIPVDSFTLNGGIGTATQTGVSVIRVTGTTANPQAMRTGSLTATAGAFSVTSADINVHAGLLDHISLLSPTGVVLGNTITINANTTYDFDILGYDAFGNTSNVLPQFVLVPVTGAGTMSSTGLYTAPATAQSATLVATLNGVSDSILINVVVPAGVVSTAPLSVGRYLHTATRLNDGRILIVGGVGNSGFLASAEIYDHTMNAGSGGYVSTGNMASPRQVHTASLLNDGRVLVVGGHDGSGPVATAEIFDPAGNGGLGAFSAIGNLQFARYNHTAAVLQNGKVLVAGGNGTSGFVATAELFDPTANGGLGGFVPSGNMTNPSQGAAVAGLADGRVLITGGIGNAGYLNSSEIFDPTLNGGNGGFVATAPMSTAREYHTATRLADGRVLLAGGRISNISIATADIFDPAGNGGLGAIISTGNLGLARDLHTATLLADGRVLLTSGQNNSTITSSTEIFNPAGNAGAGQFTPGLALSNARLWHTAIRLLNGNVVISGGFDYSSALSSSERYSP